MAVFKKNGNWWVDCYVNGQRMRRKVGPDKRTAELAEKDLKVRAAKGEWLGIEQTKRITFAEFCKEFMSKQAGKAPSTVKSYEIYCRVHFVPYFGSRYLSNIRSKDIEDYVQKVAKTYQFTTVNLHLRRLKAVFNTAVRWHYLQESPARKVKPLRLPEKEPPYMDRDQIARLYEACSRWVHTFVAIALNTGLRLSEITSLTWEDIDFRNRVIKVRSDETFTTKGKRNREIPINEFLFRVLRKAPRHITTPLVIFTRTGEPPDKTQVWKRFNFARKTADLPPFRIHDMRHTFGTTLAANGVDVRTIQELMGHSNMQTTMQYLHAAPNRMTWAVENLRLDGTTQQEMDDEERQKMHEGGQYLVTGTKEQ